MSLATERLIHEEKLKNPQQYYRQTKTRIPSADEVCAWQANFKAPAPKRKKETLRIIFLNHLIIKLINFYQKYISICITHACRFEPTCSEYTKKAIYKYGIVKGVMKGLLRLARCHPFSGKQGYDPI